MRVVAEGGLTAALEVDLRPHAVQAVRSKHVRLLRYGLSIRQAREAHAICNRAPRIRRIPVGERVVVVASRPFVTGKHHEAFREWNGLLREHASREVVGDCTAMRNVDEAAVRVLIVQEWCPIRRFVGLDFAAAAIRVEKGVVGRVHANVCCRQLVLKFSDQMKLTGAAHNCMGMLCNGPRVDQRINASRQDLRTVHSEERVDTRSQEQRTCRDASRNPE